MKVRLFKPQTIANYVKANAGSRIPLAAWQTRLAAADWNDPLDIKKTFPSADPLGNGSRRVVFDIGGNNYRLICQYHFASWEVRLYICWLGTHAEYDKLCAKNLQYTVAAY